MYAFDQLTFDQMIFCNKTKQIICSFTPQKEKKFNFVAKEYSIQK